MGVALPGPRARAGAREVPSVASLPPGTKRGYLWRLSGRRMLYRTDWKRKYFVLQQDRLYYYETERGQAGERGSGLIELKYFMDCVEAPLTDHKKATNVFLLLAAERGFFDQGRCYLSAETLIDMKDWVSRIRGALEGLQGRGPPSSLPPALEAARGPPVRRDPGPTEPLYASIREESIHRSNSLSTLPSLRGDTLLGEAEDWHNRSMDEGPVCGLGGVDHNLTYNYSSSEESLNESFSIVIGPKPPRSADGSMRRGPLQARPRPEITLQSHEPAYAAYEEVGEGACSTFPRHSSPAKRSAASVKSSSDYLARMYSEMARVDEQLEMVSRVETDGGSVSEAGSPGGGGSPLPSRGSSGPSRPPSQATVKGSKGSQGSLHKMEQMLKQVVRQSEELYGVFRQLETESQGGREQLPGALGARLARYQGSLVALERQATDLMVEIKETHNRVVQSLEEAEQARRDFLQLKERAEFILGQLQGEAARHPPAMAPRPFSQYEPVAASQTFPKQKVPAAGRPAPETASGSGSGRGRVAFCQDPLHPSEPVYAQAVKKADREKEKPEPAGGYSKPTYEAPGLQAARSSPAARRYSAYSPRGPRGPLAGEERWSPGARRQGEPGPRSPLAQEERCSPGPEEAVAGPTARTTGAQVIYAHRKEVAGQEPRPGLQALQARPRSLFFQPAKRD